MLPIRHSLREAAIRHSPLLALILLAIYPILSGGLPATGDGLNHYYRFVELDWHIRNGDLYPRWFANMGYGFGMPVLNFYAPLSYYIPLVFRVFGLSLAASLQLGYALALALAILGARQWAAALFPSTQPADANHLAPLVVAAAYGLAPYFYFNIFHRGAYPETWALALAPWLLWSIHELITRNRPFFIIHCSLFISAIVLTHTLSALILLPIAILYFAAIAFSAPTRSAAVKPIVHSSLFILHSSLFIVHFLALTAFFTIPVLFESQYIQLSRAYSTGDLDYHRNFLAPATLLSLPPNFDPRLVFNVMPPSLGWPQLALAAFSFVVAAKQWMEGRKQRAITPLLLTASCLLLSVFTLSFTEPVWNLVPFARFIQFPWRLVGPASLFLAALAGTAALRLANKPFGIWILASGICSFFFFSLPWTYHADFDLQSAIYNLQSPHAPTDTIRYEITSGQMGTASTAEYLPRWAAEIPDPQTLLPQFADSERPSRLAPLPSDIAFHASRLSPTSEELVYTSASPFTATYNIFYFPGWAAALDGNRIDVQPSTPHGLITVALPAGSHTLRLYRQLTPSQFVGSLVSLAALIILIILLVRRPSSIAHRSPLANLHAKRPISTRSVQSPITISLFIASLLFARVLYFDRAETIFHHTSPIPNSISVNFDNQLELIGYEFPKGTQLTSGSQLPITIYWRAISPLNEDYSVSIQLADRFGNRFGQSDSQHPNGVPTSRWRPDQYARDSHALLSIAGAPPGNYQLLVTVYSDHPLSILRDDAPIGAEYELGLAAVTRGEPGPPGPLRLVESELASDTVTAGDQFAFTALWSSGDKPLPALTARLVLADSAGGSIFCADLPPSGDYLTSQWTPNEMIRYPYSVGLPPDLPGGAVEASLLLLDANGVVWAGPFGLGAITITAPERSFDIPPMQVRVDHDFGGAIRLLGYDLGPDSITLYWQSLQPVTKRLTVFVHRLDESGAFIASHDAAPGRPSTGWLPGEVIADVHPISVGNRFEVGLYDPISGERFGETFVTSR